VDHCETILLGSQRRSWVDDVPGEIVSGLTDLSEVDLDGLTALDSPVLASALQRIRDEAEHPEEAVAGFQSSL
jgi:FXSXX-COOH protein